MAEDKDLIRLKLIKNLFLQKKPAKVSYEIVLLSPATRNQPLPLQFEAEAYFLTGKLEKGLAVLARAAQTHPNEIRFPLKRIVVLAEQQLAQTAIEEALALLDHPECRPENILQVAQIFSNRQDWRSAVLLLEGARLRLFNTPTVAKALAFNYSQMGKFKLAGEVLYQSGLAHDEINLQSAELFRKAGHYNRAEWMNAQVADQGKKLKQRFGMLLQTKSFESAAALGPRLRRNGLLKRVKFNTDLPTPTSKRANTAKVKARSSTSGTTPILKTPHVSFKWWATASKTRFPATKGELMHNLTKSVLTVACMLLLARQRSPSKRASCRSFCSTKSQTPLADTTVCTDGSKNKPTQRALRSGKAPLERMLFG